MPKVISIQVKNDRSDEAIAAMRKQAAIALQSIGQEAEGFAKADCPVDTGNLRNSISNEVIDSNSELAVYIGTNVEYAPYVELRDKASHNVGKAHFLRDSIATHGDRYKDILEAALNQ